jgi:hypothetical protein
MSKTSNLAMSAAIVAVFGIGISYYGIMARSAEIRADWSANRCDPRVMPFAGIINPPDSGTAGEFTAANFASCMSSTGKTLAADAVAPAHYLVGSLTSTVSALGNSVQAARGAVNSMRHAAANITDQVATRTYNTALPAVRTAMTTKSTLQKAQAVVGTGFFGAQSGLLMASASIGAMTSFLLVMSSIFIASGGSLLAIPFCLGCPVGIPLLALGIAVLGVCIAVMVIVQPKIPTVGIQR